MGPVAHIWDLNFLLTDNVSSYPSFVYHRIILSTQFVAHIFIFFIFLLHIFYFYTF